MKERRGAEAINFQTAAPLSFNTQGPHSFYRFQFLCMLHQFTRDPFPAMAMCCKMLDAHVIQRRDPDGPPRPMVFLAIRDMTTIHRLSVNHSSLEAINRYCVFLLKLLSDAEQGKFVPN
jgi:hypothetical protein